MVMLWCSILLSLAVSLWALQSRCVLLRACMGYQQQSRLLRVITSKGLVLSIKTQKKSISTNFTTWLYHPERSPIKKARFFSPVEGWLFNGFIGPKCCNHLPGLKFEPGIPPGSKALVIRTQGPGHGNGNSPMFNRRYHLQMVVFPLSC